MIASIYPIQTAAPYRVAILARPRGDDWLSDEIAALSRAGIQAVVSLLTRVEAGELGLLHEVDECASAGITFLNVAIADRSLPSNEQEFRQRVDEVAQMVRAGRSVGIHCRASIGRSSVFTVALLTRLGWNPEKAFEAVEIARGCSVPDTAEQRRWALEKFTSDLAAISALNALSPFWDWPPQAPFWLGNVELGCISARKLLS